MSQTLRSSKKLQNVSFLKLFVRVSGSGSACVSSPISSDARNEEYIIVSGFLWESHFLVISPLTRVMRRT